MILCDEDILDLCMTRQLVTPFDADLIQPASLDLRLGFDFIDKATGQQFKADSLHMVPGRLYLAHTLEYLRLPNGYAGDLKLKSTIGRKDINHALSGWIDPGFFGTLTLELSVLSEQVIKAGHPIVQIVIHKMRESRKPYQGRYQGQDKPTAAREPKAE